MADHADDKPEVIYFYVKGQGWLGGYKDPNSPVLPWAGVDYSSVEQDILRQYVGSTRMSGASEWTGRYTYSEDRAQREIREREEEAIRVRSREQAYERALLEWRQIPRTPSRTANFGTPLTQSSTRIPPVTRPQSRNVNFGVSYGYSPYEQRPARNPTTTLTPDELAENSGRRFFPGSGENATVERQESVHERRSREYREELERQRRRRGR